MLKGLPLWKSDAIGEAKPSNSYSASKYVKVQNKQLSASHGQFFAERPYIDMYSI